MKDMTEDTEKDRSERYYEELTKTLQETREYLKQHPLEERKDVTDMYVKHLRTLGAMAVYSSWNDEGNFQTSALAKEFMQYAVPMENNGCRINDICTAAADIASSISDRPRLKLRLLEFEMKLINRPDCKYDDDVEEIARKIEILKRNISYADNHEFDKLENPYNKKFYIKQDPVEWTKEYEDVIDEAERIINEKLKDKDRGPGFCHTYWHVKSRVLFSMGVEWRSPSQMNPYTLFD